MRGPLKSDACVDMVAGGGALDSVREHPLAAAAAALLRHCPLRGGEGAKRREHARVS